MTPDEVMALTNEELRIKAAELMGAKSYLTPREGCRVLSLNSAICLREAIGTEPVCIDGLRNIPDYPNDIAAAMGLFARLCKMRTNCTIYVANGAGCHCWDVMGGPGRDYENGIHGYADWEEGTLRAVCRAITRAFILAREAD